MAMIGEVHLMLAAAAEHHRLGKRSQLLQLVALRASRSICTGNTAMRHQIFRTDQEMQITYTAKREAFVMNVCTP
jgi:hypothetical protein